MSSVLAVTFPFFALVLCGYLAARRNILAPAAIPGLNGFVLYFALPCMLFRFGAQTPLARLLDMRIAGVYLACALVLVAALPSASNVALLTERFGAHNGRIARIILVSTVLAFLTFSGAVALLL